MASAYAQWKDSDEELSDEDNIDEETDDSSFKFKPSYLLIAIDTSQSMFRIEDSADGSAFARSLDVCYKLIDSLLFVRGTSLKGPLAIVFAENNATKATFVEFEHSVPETIKMLDELRGLSDVELESKYVRKDNFDLGNFFLLCKNKLASIKGDVFKRNVVYLTNDDEPVKQNDSKMIFKVKNEVQKFLDLQIHLYMYTFSSKFDNDAFYSDILKECNSSPVCCFTDDKELQEKLEEFVQRRYTRHRQTLYLCKGKEDFPKIAVTITKFKRSSTLKTSFVTRDKEKSVIKKMPSKNSETYEVKVGTGSDQSHLPVKLNDLEKQNLEVTEEMPIGLSLLCVSTSLYEDGRLAERPFFVQVDDRETNSVDRFQDLWDYCRVKKRVLVCYFKRSIGGSVKMLELEPKLINGAAAFLARVIPYSLDFDIPEEVEDDDETKSEVLSQDELKVADMLVQALTFDFESDKLLDPVQMKRESYLRSVMLNSELKNVEDYFPTDEVVDAKIESVLDKLGSFDLLEEDVPEKSTKRTTESAKTRAPKKLKKDK